MLRDTDTDTDSDTGADDVGVGAGVVVAVCRDGDHRFSKAVADRVRLLAGLGVEGDAHLGRTVQHRSRVARDPSQPNLRQVHLVHVELLEALGRRGFRVGPGDLGENVTTSGIDLLGLPTGTLLHLGPTAVVRVTGLRNPCRQIDTFAAGLLRHVVHTGQDGGLVRLAGVMAVVVDGGELQAGDAVAVELPSGPARALEPV